MIEVKASEILDKLLEGATEDIEVTAEELGGSPLEKIASYGLAIQDAIQNNPEYAKCFGDVMYEKVAGEGYLFKQALAEIINGEMDKMAADEMPAEEYVEKMALEILGGFEENLCALEKEANIYDESFEETAKAVKNQMAKGENIKKSLKIKDTLAGGAVGTAAGAVNGALIGTGIGALKGTKIKDQDGNIVKDEYGRDKKDSLLGARKGALIGSALAGTLMGAAGARAGYKGEFVH